MHKNCKARKVKIGNLKSMSTRLSWMGLFVLYDTNHGNGKYTQKTKTIYSIKMYSYESLVCFVIESSDRLVLQQLYLLPTFAV